MLREMSLWEKVACAIYYLMPSNSSVSESSLYDARVRVVETRRSSTTSVSNEEYKTRDGYVTY
jgi:hypothetical protein